MELGKLSAMGSEGLLQALRPLAEPELIEIFD